MKTTKTKVKSTKEKSFEKLKNMKSELIAIKSDAAMTRVFAACISFSDFLNSSGNI
ncbi:MAG TPA: hypothetical protein PLC65_11890 [Bacteroidia bacterium]|nr:hypothetical protein [Bacteroidia bacterium]HRD39326.1 hypothetical protein [Bacteroidia bacterium]